MKKILVLFTSLFLCACAANLDTTAYNTSAAGRINNVQEGVIINVRQVSVTTEDGTAGTIAGGLGGAVLGSNIGGGSTANTLGAIGGAVLGGYLGNKAQEGLSKQTGIEYIVKLDSGKAITLTQGNDVVFSVGQPVYVLDGGSDRARIIAR